MSLKVGHSYELKICFSEEKCKEFISVSNDVNKYHTDKAFAINKGYFGELIHGTHVVSVASTIPAVHLYAEDSVLISQKSEFFKPLYRDIEYIMRGELVKIDLRFGTYKYIVHVLDENEKLVAKCEFNMKK